jgi:uncharacterized protein (TIGR02118 family)
MPKIRVTALYRKPEDVEEFMDHYEGVHLPLVRQVPGLERLEVSRVFASGTGGEPPYFLIAEMDYPDRDTFRSAMRSEQNAAVSQDVGQFAAGLTDILISEVLE